MHSGFVALRTECPMNLRRTHGPLAVSQAVMADVTRIETMWQSCFDDSKHGGGHFLFDDFSIVDAMYAPVWSRIKTYQLSTHPVIDRFGAALEALPAWHEWCASAALDQSVVDADEV